MGYYTCWTLERPVQGVGGWVAVSRGSDKIGYEITTLIRGRFPQLFGHVKDATSSLVRDEVFIDGPWNLNATHAHSIKDEECVKRCQKFRDTILSMAFDTGDRLIVWGDP